MNHFSKIQMGVDYYPEHWDPSLWEQDAIQMKEVGVKIVRVGEFAWSRFEPEEGEFNLEWLDRAIDIFHRHDIQIVIGTPTHTPPRWLTESCPDILPLQANGQIYHAGVRGHRCFNSVSLLSYGSRIIEKLTLQYKDHPAVIGWQTDNEFSLVYCHCETCNEQFRKWLQMKYGTLEQLNQEWGTVVWSGEYNDWSQVTTPNGGSPHQNPSYQLDFYRFQSNSVQQYQQSQIDIIRRNCPEHFITHNFHSYPQKLDLYPLGKPLDVAAFDYYPNTSPDKISTGPYSGALSLDVTRGIKRRNFWIMEQLSGPPGGWGPMWRTPYPGFIRAYIWQSIARGADTVVQFRWRSATMGAEQFWHGLIDHSNVPGRRFEEFSQVCQEVNTLANLLEGSIVRNDVAILHSHDQLVALDIQPQVEGLDYYENIKQWHRALTKQGIGTDVIHWTENLSGYKLIIAPSLYLMDSTVATSLEAFAAAGGTLIITHRSGVKNHNNVCLMEPLPGMLSHCAGVQVSEYDPIANDVHHIITTDEQIYSSTQWCDILHLTTAEVVASYHDDFYAGKAAITVNRFGKGKVYYLGTHPEERYMKSLLHELAIAHDILHFPELPEGVQISVRIRDSQAFYFLLNLSRESRSIVLGHTYKSVLYDGITHEGILTLESYGVDICVEIIG
jgi:beta-galactosidase